MNQQRAIVSTPIGCLQIITHENCLIAVEMMPADTALVLPESSYLIDVVDELQEYFAGQLQQFQLTLHMKATPFRAQVWQHLQSIPYGETRTYGQLARELNTAPRAIGQACRHNPFLVVVPCHRILAATHEGGYSGHIDGPNMDIKRWLLNHERQHRASATSGPFRIALAREKVLCI